MIQANIIQSMSDSKWRIRALEQYQEEINNNYSKLIAILNDALTYIPDDYSTLTDQQLNDRINQLEIEYDMNLNCDISFPDGYIYFNDLYKFLYIANERYSDPDLSMMDGLITSTIHPFDIEGNELTDVSYTAQDVMTIINEQYHSSIALQSLFSSVKEETVAGRLQLYTENIKMIFQNAYSSDSEDTNYYRKLIINSNTVDDLIDNVINVVGIESRSDNNINDSTISATDLYQFTGASPLGAMDFGNAQNKVLGATKATAKILIKASKKIFSGLLNVGKKIFNKVKNAISTTFVNPYDIYVADEKSDVYSINGWSIDSSDSTYVDIPYRNDLYPDADPNDVIAYLNQNANMWYKFKTLFGEVLVKFSRFQYSSGYIQAFAVSKLKPYCIDKNALIEAARGNGYFTLDSAGNLYLGPNANDYSHTSTTIEEMCSFFSEFRLTKMYLEPTGANEEDVAQGFAIGLMLLEYFSGYALNEMLSYTNFEVGDRAVIKRSNVTNKTFVTLASGWNQSVSNPQFSFKNIYDMYVTGIIWPAVVRQDFAIENFIKIISMQLIDKHFDPLNYAFVPYIKNLQSFDSSRFAVKTDQENIAAAENFAATAIAVVIVAAVAITGVIITKKITKALLSKRLLTKSTLDNKMWNGERLTKRELRRYIKASRKIDGSRLLTSNLQNSSSVLSSSLVSNDLSSVNSVSEFSATGDDMDALRKLITG